jgi:hypothetical protein
MEWVSVGPELLPEWLVETAKLCVSPRSCQPLQTVRVDDLDPVDVDTEAPSRSAPPVQYASLLIPLAIAVVLALAVTAVGVTRLARQGERRDCMEAANARAGLENLHEPDGRSSQRVAAERYARCYGISDTSAVRETTTTVVLTHAIARCPNTEQPFERPRTNDESGDGLPPAGSASVDAAMRVARRQAPQTNPRVVAVPGRAWRRDDDGKVLIEDELLYTVQVTVGALDDCPQGPVFNTVPLIPYYEIS